MDAPPPVPKKRLVKASEKAAPVTVKQEPVEDASPATDANILPAEVFTHGGVRKAKFEPKIPARRQKKVASVKSETEEGTVAELPSELLKLVKQSQEDAAARGARRTDIRAATRVAFGSGSSVSGRAAASFSKGGSTGTNVTGGEKKPSKSLQGDIESGMIFDEKEDAVKKSSWDLSKYYPVTLPLQKPGVAESLEDDQSVEFEENTVPVADELALMEESGEDQVLFFQLPSILPLSKTTAPTSKGYTKDQASSTWLENLPPGHMGKLLVYRSGAVKLRLGDTLYEAVTGSQCVFAQELVGINPTTQHCCFLGDITKKADYGYGRYGGNKFYDSKQPQSRSVT